MRQGDFFDLKADVETLLAGARPTFGKVLHPAFHPGRAASVCIDGRQIGVLGELHPRWVQKYELGTAPLLAELELDSVLEQRFPIYREVSRFPAVTRDLALIVPHELSWDTLSAALDEVAPAIVVSMDLFDLYQGRGIAEGRKSLAFRVVMQDTQRTLEDSEIDSAVAVLVAAAERRFGAELRR